MWNFMKQFHEFIFERSHLKFADHGAFGKIQDLTSKFIKIFHIFWPVGGTVVKQPDIG